MNVARKLSEKGMEVFAIDKDMKLVERASKFATKAVCMDITNIDAFEKIIRLMKENNFGYGAINHPVDRDPVCGYVGVIKDVCPGCGRRAYEGVSVEKLRSASANCGTCK